MIPGASRRASEIEEPPYDNFRIIAPANPDLIAAHRCRESQYINIPLNAPPSDPVSPRPDTPFSEIDEDELGELFDDVIKEGQRLNANLADVSVEIHTPPPDTDGFGSVKNLLQNFKQEEKTGIDNRGQDHRPPRAVVQVGSNNTLCYNSQASVVRRCYPHLNGRFLSEVKAVKLHLNVFIYVIVVVKLFI